MVNAEKDIEALKSLQFSFGTIKRATQNFSDDHVLGRGGFGTVYKVRLNYLFLKYMVDSVKYYK